MSKTLNLRAFQLCGAASTLVLMSGFSLALAQDQTNSALIFKPAYVVSATDIPYPIQSIAIGTVMLEVVVSETGKVDSVLPIREIDSLTEVAIDSVKNWKFRAARPSGCCCVAIPRSSGGLERRTAELVIV
jgi:hypothetical protein